MLISIETKATTCAIPVFSAHCQYVRPARCHFTIFRRRPSRGETSAARSRAPSHFLRPSVSFPYIYEVYKRETKMRRTKCASTVEMFRKSFAIDRRGGLKSRDKKPGSANFLPKPRLLIAFSINDFQLRIVSQTIFHPLLIDSRRFTATLKSETESRSN